MSMTYDFVQPYLKGFHLSEDAWRSDRNCEGWKLRRREVVDAPEDWLEPEAFTSVENILAPIHPSAPTLVKPVPRLQADVRTLQRFFEPTSPIQVLVRPVEGALYVAYGAGDASGEGFGSRVKPIGMLPLLRRGIWCTEDSEESSNWRELRNIVEAIREEARRGRLVGREVWLATDNMTAATAYHKGASTSPALHEMVTELRMLTLPIFHIAGTRMIEIGIDGLSRGELQIGALEGGGTCVIPLHLAPTQRSPSLLKWLATWLGEDWRLAQPTDWFHGAQQAGDVGEPPVTRTWVWDLPPAAAIHAIEELGMACLKCHGVIRGVVFVPSILRNEWLRRFTWIVDFYFTIDKSK